MLIFLYGEDDYSSRQKLNEIIAKYQAKHKTGLNFSWLDFDEKEFKDFKNIASSASMFKEKKLIVLEGIFKKGIEFQKEISEYLKKIKVVVDEEILIVICEKTVDKRTELFKFLTKKPNISQEFKLLDGVKLENWIKKEVEKRRGKIEAGAESSLAIAVGNNLWQMANEIEKLILFCDGKEIREKDISLLIKPKVNVNIFNTADALADKDKRHVLKFLHQHLNQGDSKEYLMSMFVRQFRNLLVIKDLMEKGIPYYEFAKRTGLHPFVAKKASEQARNFNLERLKKIYNKCLEIDINTKTGKMDMETALDMLAMSV